MDRSGETRILIRYDEKTGKIYHACIDYVSLNKDLEIKYLKGVVYHEVFHIFESSYVKYISKFEAKNPPYSTWYYEGLAEGIAAYFTKSTERFREFFHFKCYEKNPYKITHTSECSPYSWSIFFYWLFEKEKNLDKILKTILTDKSVINKYVNEMYITFLLELNDVEDHEVYAPSRTFLNLGRGKVQLKVHLEGLSAKYFKIRIPSLGRLFINVDEKVMSNAPLSRWFELKNTTYYLVLINPEINYKVVNLVINYLRSRPKLKYMSLNVSNFNIINLPIEISVKIKYEPKIQDYVKVKIDSIIDKTIPVTGDDLVKLQVVVDKEGVYNVCSVFHDVVTCRSVIVNKPVLDIRFQGTLLDTMNGTPIMISPVSVAVKSTLRPLNIPFNCDDVVIYVNNSMLLNNYINLTGLIEVTTVCRYRNITFKNSTIIRVAPKCVEDVLIISKHYTEQFRSRVESIIMSSVYTNNYTTLYQFLKSYYTYLNVPSWDVVGVVIRNVILRNLLNNGDIEEFIVVSRILNYTSEISILLLLTLLTLLAYIVLVRKSL